MAVTVAVLLSTACVPPPFNPYVTEACPLPTEARGYPITARSVGNPVPKEFLGRVARAVAAASDFKGLRQGDTLPADVQRWRAANDRGRPFSRDGWNPEPGDTASVEFAYQRGQARPAIRVVGITSGADEFQRRAFQAALDARASSENGDVQADTLPLTAPMTTSDSVIVRVRFGVEPRSGDGVARFAVQEQAVAPTSWNRPPAYPSTEQAYGVTGEVRLAFVVDSTGVVDRTTIRVLRASTREFADAAVRAVSDYRFIPEELNCRRLAIVVEEPFVFGQKMQRPSTAPS